MKAAIDLVVNFIEHNWESGITPEQLLGQFTGYVEDPIIIPNENGVYKYFSAFRYARYIAKLFAKRWTDKQLLVSGI